MAENIKIVGSILNTTQVSRYTADDLRLITSQKIQKSFGAPNDYIEYYVYDIGNTLLETSYNYREYKLPSDVALNSGINPNLNINNTTSTGAEVGSVSNLSTTASYPIIEIDPVMDLENLGYSSGEFKVQYNIFKNKISSFPSASLFIKEISPDRTEIRAGSVILTNDQIESGSLALINYYNSSSYFDPFLLNFGNNVQELVTNIVLNKVDTGYEILFKLYNELDDIIDEKTSFWVVEEVSTPYVFDINLDAILAAPAIKKLKGPNFRNRRQKRGSNTTNTAYQNADGLDLNDNSLLNLNISQSISININYDGEGGENGGFGNFVTFGSALSRIQNFFTKVQQIETGNNFINYYTPYISTTSSLQSEINSYSSSINNTITNFDGFENYLYFNSGSLTSSLQYGITPYPKLSTNKPYILYPSTASQAVTWYNNIILNAEDYDSDNINYFKYSVPSYVVDDPDNANYLIFLNMMGQYFDNIWIYIKSITDINLANNNLNVGISKDVVYNLLQSLGISVFNSFGDNTILQYLSGANTGSYSYSGSLNDFSYTSSYLNNIPKKDLLAESYKRIYHNLPLLLQRKGTVAGLRTLLSTFGILNQDYYTKIDNLSGSYVGGKLITGSLFVTNSYYTPTGSAISSSILNVKEFGGSSKTGMLAGYNNDKVRIVSNITASVSGTFGNVLSPYSTITQYSTASSNFRTIDENYVDISFSPQTQIDTYISKSIASNNSSWVIDDYIGDPRQLYSGSYSDLITQRNIYFGGTGSYPGFTSSLMDYNGFIRLVQFFDNSMFKMLEDYVPARTSLTTGITINSPALERNKWSYARPSNTTNELEKDGKINAPIFTSIYDDYYSSISGSRAAYFTGELSGSQLSINNYFTTGNFNPYLHDLTPYNNNQSPYQQANTNNFLHSDFNILLNNVSKSLYSISRQKLEISGSSGILGSGSYALLVTASLQDSYLSLSSYILPRYNGSKISSTKYNTYTDGDQSYGKTAAIDHYVRKFGLFTQIVSSSFFLNRNTTALKYLVDESGSLTELSQTPLEGNDSHWAEVQNTFKLGKSSTVALFDNQQYNNQKSTDGEKLIFDSGYSYYPTLYYTGSDSKLFFQYAGEGTSILIHIDNEAGFINGSTINRYAVTGGFIYNIFDDLDTAFEGNQGYYKLGGNNNFPSYSVPQNTNMDFTANFGINFQFGSSPQSSSYTFSIISGSNALTGTLIASQSFNFTSSATALATTFNFNTTSSFRDFKPDDKIFFKLQQITSSNNYTASLLSTGDRTIFTGLRNSIGISTIGIDPFATSSLGSFISQSNGVDTLLLNKSLSGFKDYLYQPATSSVSLYNNYGNINDIFSPKVGDVILIYYNNDTQLQELNVISAVIDSSIFKIRVSPNLVNTLAVNGSYPPTLISKVLILSKQPDETNTNLNFNKEDGQTSYGFLIPDNLSPDILKNIDTITKQVKQKILSTDQGITINTV